MKNRKKIRITNYYSSDFSFHEKIPSKINIYSFYPFSLIPVDPEIYVPRNDEERYNEVDFDAINNEDQKLKTEVAVESVVIIVLASILGKFLYNILK